MKEYQVECKELKKLLGLARQNPSKAQLHEKPPNS